MKIKKEKNLICKGKHTVKVIDQPLIKPIRILKDKSCKLNYIYYERLKNP